ncbi:glutaredoxin family protein [Acidovorax sp. HDW3]|uniref:glutaredoxin family protein n=1 Tax=Acidovorax sp. HDW3 TaxID=2714923 RepID=UPI00140B6B80|nr:glutaredoxin family protein [Acidovorax sp. HDW3]QIL43812.1 glutaredoxin family protein [Acidovorax sp. HDW3]
MHTIRFAPRPALLAACACAALLASAAVQAQQVYRSVGPDGKVTFTDRAPDTQTAPSSVRSAGAGAQGGLPYELQQIASRYPVTLYTGKDCPPCTSARSLLTARGIPFTERTVSTNDDIDAFKRLSGGTSLPFGTIGRQQLTGFSESEWTQYLDLAGYPKQSQLPPSYRRPAATPLVAVSPTPAAPDKAEPSPRPAPAPADGGPGPSNPAGIIF